jgi:hypothetical protein
MIKATTMIIGEAASRSLRGSSVHHGNLGRSNSNGAGSVHANRTVDQMASAVSGVVPQDYLPSVYGSAEWQAAWADDSLVQLGGPVFSGQLFSRLFHAASCWFRYSV